MGKLHQTEGIVAPHKVETVLLVQDGQGEGAFQLFGNPGQYLHVQCPGECQHLYGNITVCLDPRLGEMQLMAQQQIVVQNAVVSQSKVGTAAWKVSIQIAGEGMVVIVILCIPLRGHPHMAHDHMRRGRR